MDISVLIPAYKGLSKIPETLKKLKFDGDFEVIVAGDSLSEDDIKFLKKTGVILYCCNERRGKVNAVNGATEIAKGELFVFLDSDTRPESEDFLNNIWKNYKKTGFEIATGKLMIEGNSRLERSINVEYLFMNTAFFVANWMKNTMPVCGAFIVMPREAFIKLGRFSKVVVEDLDLGFKAVKHKLKFSYIKDAVAFTASPKKIKEWLAQRKRWWMGGAHTIKASKKEILKSLPSTTAAATSYYPLPVISILSLVFVLLAMSQFKIMYVLSITAFTTSSLMLLMNKVLNWGITFLDGLSYLFIYGPVLSVITVGSLLYFFVKKGQLEDWKV
ncbi:MAG: glycosyltransferase family 2 protein [Candidatus Altiarchaeota archaeon]|nr:glycosyltransferase family 2 protein [Candidatus Altiarchaeota archaeon]